MSLKNVFEIQNQQDHSMIRFFGFIDASAVQKIKPLLLEKIPPNSINMIIDLRQVDFLDSHGVGLFVSLLKKTHKSGGRLIFTGVQGQPASVLHMVGFNDTLVSYCETAAEACNLLRTPEIKKSG